MPIRIFVTILILLAVATACGPSGASPHPGVLRVPVVLDHGRLDPGVLVPRRATEATPLFLTSLFQAGLVKLSPDLHVIPDLAVSIPTVSADGMSYTFTIRQDARFANGTSVTAKDVAASLTDALRYGSPLARRYLGGIAGAGALETGTTDALEGVTVLHRLTVRIVLAAPDATFLQKLAFPVASVVRATRSGYPLTLGPWQLSSRDRNGDYDLTPRPHYHSAALTIRSLRLVPVRNASQAYALYRSGGIDLTWVPSDRFASLSTRSDFHGSDALDAYFAIPSRQNALTLAGTLDRDRLASDVGPSAVPLQSIVPPAVPDYVPSIPAVSDPNVTASHSHLVLDDRTDPTERIIARALQRQWPAGKGDTTRVQLIHVAFMLPDPGRWLGIAERVTSSTWYRSLLPESNALTNDPVTRMSQYNEGEGWALEHAFVIPLLSGRIGYLVKPAVGSLQVTPLGIMPENNNWSLVTVT